MSTPRTSLSHWKDHLTHLKKMEDVFVAVEAKNSSFEELDTHLADWRTAVAKAKQYIDAELIINKNPGRRDVLEKLTKKIDDAQMRTDKKNPYRQGPNPNDPLEIAKAWVADKTKELKKNIELEETGPTPEALEKRCEEFPPIEQFMKKPQKKSCCSCWPFWNSKKGEDPDSQRPYKSFKNSV